MIGINLFLGLCLIPFRDKIKEKLIKSLSVKYYEFLSGARKSKFRIIELFWICFDTEADEKFVAGGDSVYELAFHYRWMQIVLM